MNCFFLLILLEILLFIVAFLMSGQDIMAPSVMFCAMFIISTLFCVPFIDRWNIDYGIETVVILFTGIYAFILAEAFIRSMYKRGIERFSSKNNFSEVTTEWPILKPRTRIVVFVIIFNAIVTYLYYSGIARVVSSYGFKGVNISATYRYITVAERFENVSNAASINRYLIHLVKIVKAAGFVACFALLNNKVAKYKDRVNVYYLIITIQSLIPGLLVGGRNEVLRLFSAALAEYYILWHQKNGWNKNYSFKYIKIGVRILLIGIPLFYLLASFVGRGSHSNVFSYAAVYLGSGIVLFDLFCKSNPVNNMLWGQESLHGIYGLLSIFGVKAPSGDVSLEFRTSGEMTSNIYTFFRRPLSDFGIVGMYIFTALIAALFSWLYFCKIKRRSRSVKTDYFVLSYGFLFYWIIAASTEQRSTNYLSGDAIEILVFILLGYMLIIHQKSAFSMRGLVYERNWSIKE